MRSQVTVPAGRILDPRGEPMSDKKLTPLKAIRRMCYQCTNFQSKEIKECPIVECALYPYRMGKRPLADQLQYKSVCEK